MALASEPSPQIRLLLALLKYDYYVLNGLREPPPTIEDLTSGDVRISPESTAELRAAVSAPGNPLWEALVRDAI